jgi:hypothetical protein
LRAGFRQVNELGGDGQAGGLGVSDRPRNLRLVLPADDVVHALHEDVTAWFRDACCFSDAVGDKRA